MRRWLPSAALLLTLLLLWEGGVRLFRMPRYILPAPSTVILLLIHQTPLLLDHALTTLSEMGLGLLLALGTGVALAFLMFLFPALERAFLPVVIGSQTIPVFAIAPLLVLWFGYGVGSKVVMTAIIVFFPITVNTLDGLKSADPEMVNLLRVLRASRWTLLRKVHIPSALPFLFSGLKIGVSVSTIGAVIGEWVGSKKGLGYLMLHANAQLRVDLIFAAIFLLTLLGVGLYLSVVGLERLLTPWRFLKEEPQTGGSP